MITRNAGTDIIDSAVEIGIIKYYSGKKSKSRVERIKYYFSYRKLISKSYIVTSSKKSTQIDAINKVPNVKTTHSNWRKASKRLIDYSIYMWTKKGFLFFLIVILLSAGKIHCPSKGENCRKTTLC